MSVTIDAYHENNNLLPLFGLIKCIFIVKNEQFIFYNLFNNFVLNTF